METLLDTEKGDLSVKACLPNCEWVDDNMSQGTSSGTAIIAASNVTQVNSY